MKSRWLILVAGLVVAVLAAELGYFFRVIRDGHEISGNCDLVVVYSVDSTRVPAGIQLARKLGCRYFMVSDNGIHDFDLETRLFGKPGVAQVIVEGKATTTDQNARFTASMIRDLPVKRVFLVTSCFHMPRALFLARLYLYGSGVEVVPVAADEAPRLWWLERDFRMEFSKFWGSLGRAGLAFFGLVTGPPLRPVNRGEQLLKLEFNLQGVARDDR